MSFFVPSSSSSRTTRTTRARLTTACALALLAGCAILGKETPFPDVISTSGVGPYRRLGAEETRFRGKVLELGLNGIDRASFADGALFYAAAPVLEPLPARDPALAARDLDPAQFDPMRIFRSTTEVDFGFDQGDVVLQASEAWEGSFVTQPFALTLPDGQVRLYYAAAGGLGAATASSVDGTFARSGDGLIMANDAASFAGPLGAPSVAFFDGTYFLYFDDGAQIWVATSTDGLAFTLLDTDDTQPGVDPLDIPGPADADEPAESAYRSPAAYVATSPTGRVSLRLYAEALQVPEAGEMTDDRIVIAMASLDGVSFERATLPAHEANDAPAQPTLRTLEDGNTLMYLTIARGADPQLRSLEVAVDPARATYAEEESP